MKPSTLSTPLVCCSGPRPVRIMAVRGLAQQPCGLHDPDCRDAGDALDPVGPVGGDHVPDRLEAGRPLPDEVGVDQPFADRDVEEAVRQRPVGARRDLEMQAGAARGGGQPRVDHDQPPAPALLLVEILHHHRQRFGWVGADDQDQLGLGDILQRERQAAVDAQRLAAGGRGGGHAEAAVIVLSNLLG